MSKLRTVKKCKCGQTCDPVQLQIVDNTWAMGDTWYFQYKCPVCKRILVVEYNWSRN